MASHEVIPCSQTQKCAEHLSQPPAVATIHALGPRQTLYTLLTRVLLLPFTSHNPRRVKRDPKSRFESYTSRVPWRPHERSSSHAELINQGCRHCSRKFRCTLRPGFELPWPTLQFDVTFATVSAQRLDETDTDNSHSAIYNCARLLPTHK